MDEGTSSGIQTVTIDDYFEKERSVMYKSQLQEYAQKAGLMHPTYDHVKEGASHEPRFKSTVWVNNQSYESAPGFPTLRSAEHAAAKVALDFLQKTQTSGVVPSPVHESGLCKNLLQEFAQKKRYSLPHYKTMRQGEEHSLVFTATVEIAGVSYSGGGAKSKKEAEIKAARTAFLAIQASQPGDIGSHRNYSDTSVHCNAAHCNSKSCLDVSDACIYMNKLFKTWRENDWHDEGEFLRLNKKKCEDLLSYLKQAKESYHSNNCKIVAREFLAAIQQAKFLVDESSHKKWLLKALELWDCSQHFFEVFKDLFWWAHTMSSGVNNNTSEHLNCWVKEHEMNLSSQRHPEQLLQAQSDDKKILEAMVRRTIQDKTLREGDPEHQLALLLKDRLNHQNTTWHPPLLTSFLFCIRSRIHLLSRSSSKSGQNGVVLRFPWVYDKQFAVKMRQPNTDTVENMFKHEFDILDKYRSPYIVGVWGYWELQSRLDLRPWTTLCPFLLMEAMECDLEGLICKYKELRLGKSVGFSPLETIKLLLPVAKALRFLHDNDVAHRDIKPQNIMCSNALEDLQDASVKLIDFGEARLDASRIPADGIGVAGTDGYMDPAMWTLDSRTRRRTRNPEGYDLLRADVFSFAMIFVELLTWRFPWEEAGIQRGRDVQDKLNNGERPPLPKGLPAYVSFIVECCWCADPPARPAFKDICSMLQNAKLVLLDETFFGTRDDLFRYEDGECVRRTLANRAFLEM